MLQPITEQTMAQPKIISTLSRLRQEWQEATEGTSLLEINGNMGLVMADLINNIGLPIEEQVQVLETELFQEMQDLLKSPVHN